MNSMNEFELLQEEYVECVLTLHPEMATFLGYTTHDTEMPSGKLEDVKKEIEQKKDFLAQFQNIDASHLDFDERITRTLAIYRLQIELFVDETLHHYVKNPDCALGVSDALDSLFKRKSAQRFYPLLERLEKTPHYIADFKTRVVTPTHLWTEMAQEAAKGLIQFLHIIVEAAQKEIPAPDAEEIENYARIVETSLKEYIQFLQDVLPEAVTPWAMDKKTFDTLLQLRMLPYTGDEILALGWTWYTEEQKRLHTLAESIAPGKSVDEVTTLVKGMHPPTFEEVLHLYTKYVETCRQFVIDHDILTLPEGEQFCVEAMPEYLRHMIPLAACHPAPAVGEDRIGYLYVTPHEDPVFLREHNEPSVISGCVHEGYPGHHIQLWCSSMHRHKLRWGGLPLSGGAEMVEGWAHYCEEMMMEKGLHTTQEYRFMQSRAVLWRAARIIVDVQMSRGDITFDEAVAFLVKMGMERVAAVGEVKWYSQLPSYPLSYLLGKHMLKDLKEKVKTMMGRRYTEKFFHNTLMYEGTLPLALFEKVFNHKTME
jgi:uncharacterized protein (DUF885 family)